jgi:photosystem II stability/assembly factor-like uncharacterized protein
MVVRSRPNTQESRTVTIRRPAAFAASVLALLTAVVALAPARVPAASAAACPPGYERMRTDRAAPTWVTRLREATAAQAPAPGCVRINRPESAGDLFMANEQQAARTTGPFTSVKAGAREAALAQRLRLAGSSVPGTTGAWEPVGNTPLIANDTEYDSVSGEGLVELAGRIQDFAYDSRPGRDIVYAATAQGGVWKSADRGNSWTSVSDTLQQLTTGSVAWSPAGGGAGTLVVVTGDSNGGGNSYTGTGVYRSTDGGATWTHATGVPSGLLGFRAAADPTNPSTFYAATGGGLFRSTDAGKTFTNVALPTGDCAGQPAVHPCFFANQVTDVVVQAPDDFGHDGGKVVAAVGWRAGAKTDADGHPQAPGNGLYGSADGAPGSFVRLDGPTDGFASAERIGRTELGAATGPDQDHDYLYAVVQDAVKFNQGVPVTDANEVPVPVAGVNNVLAGIYVSADFGDTWTLMQDGEALSQGAAAEGSALGGTAQATLYSPGVQAWYNEWIKPDPSLTDSTTSAPTRLLFGLEEVWQNEVINQPMVGPTSFKVIGRYFGGSTCFFLGVPALPYCPPYRGEPQGGTTTHPDQHGAIFLPGPGEGVTLLVGNDGGVYRQVSENAAEFTNAKWGDGQNRGFHTLMPYGVAVAKDGIVWAGLQDNGHMKIEKSGRQVMTMGGDGTWALVDPDDSDTAYEATPNAGMRVTTDGGRNWRDIDPTLTDSQFVTQFAMDPFDSAHLAVGGREIRETLNAPGSTWVTVFDLGTVDNPGAPPGDLDMSASNRQSAIGVRGDALYVGFCGICDVVTGTGTFKSGIATNVGGDADPSAGSPDGWHIAAANGLPERYVSSVAIDPDDPKTVYATVGGYSRLWVPPGANGDAAEGVGDGHVFKSTDAGENFTDITGDLVDAPANFVLVHGSQLLVATDFGAFASSSRNGGTWGLLGAAKDLPLAPVYHFTLRPGTDGNELYASTFGRGIYKYSFVPGKVPVEKPPVTKPPVAKPPVHIPTTGLPAAVPVVALLTTGTALALRRRRSRTPAAPAA